MKIHAIDTLAEFLALRESHAPLSPQPYLLCRLGTASTETAAIAAALQAFPGPVIGVGGVSGDDPLAAACDTVVADAVQAAPLVTNIERSPIAASVLVQTLRACGPLPLADALNLESLAYATLQSGPEFKAWHARQTPSLAAPVDDGPAVLLSRMDDDLDIQLNRPSNFNAMTVEMRDALNEALELVIHDSSLRGVRLSGRGRCFSTGGDLREFGTAPDPATAHLIRNLTLPGRLLAACAARVVADLHGSCIGSGIEFPSFAGHITADAQTWFQLPELKYGLIPGAGGCVSISRRIGRQRTAWLVLSGKRIQAPTALAWGLIDAIRPQSVQT